MPTFDHKITPMLWFDGRAEEAARLYVSVFPGSSIGAVSVRPDGTPLVIEFTLAGHRFTALNGGPQYDFTPAISFVIECETQKEVDDYWNALSDGGPPEAQQCGWLVDRFGVSWQVVPRQLGEYLSDPDSNRAERTMQAMLQMKKLDVEGLRRAHDGEE
jgi:predicted 3-demethylubiquinone-9 3-methyltransferase (glyoxalase superfamily)